MASGCALPATPHWPTKNDTTHPAVVFKSTNGPPEVGERASSMIMLSRRVAQAAGPAVILTVMMMICALSIKPVMPSPLEPLSPTGAHLGHPIGTSKALNWRQTPRKGPSASASGETASSETIMINENPRKALTLLDSGDAGRSSKLHSKRSPTSHEEPGMEALAGLVNDANEETWNDTFQQAGGGALEHPARRAPSSKQQQILEQQVHQRRRTLMELKQKYMTNRAINDQAYYILLLIYSLFILFGTISNALICLTVILKPKILSPRNIFIVNLAGSDLLLCVFTMPFSFIEISMKMWQMGLLPCKLVAGLQATSIFVSTISITAIALDRYRVIVYSTHQEATTNNSRSAALMLASVWFVALLLSLPLFSFRTVEHMELPLNHDTIKSVDFCVEAWPFAHGRGIYSVISMIFQYVLPITIVSVVYAKISDKLQKRLIRRQRLTQLECQQKKQLNLIKRTHTMLVSVSLIFGLSWLPLNLLNLIGDFSDLFGGNDQLFRIVFAICHLIGCSSACTNPVLYGYLNENFRKQFKEVYSQHAHQLLRLIRRTPLGRLFLCYCCCAGNLRMSAYAASSSSLGSATDEGDQEESSTSGSSPPESGPMINSKSRNQFDSSNGETRSDDEHDNPDDVETGKRKLIEKGTGNNQLLKSVSGADKGQSEEQTREDATAKPPGSPRAPPAALDGSANQHHLGNRLIEGEQAIRKFSFQTVTGSRQRLDRTVRFCLCLSSMSSSTESFQNELNSRQLSGGGRRSQKCTEEGELRRGNQSKRPSKIRLELQTLRKSENSTEKSLPNGGGGSSSRSSKKSKSKSRRECQCECHRKRKDQVRRESLLEATVGPRLVDGCLPQRRLSEGHGLNGRRVWLRFFPVEPFWKVSGSASAGDCEMEADNEIDKERKIIPFGRHCSSCSHRRRKRNKKDSVKATCLLSGSERKRASKLRKSGSSNPGAHQPGADQRTAGSDANASGGGNGLAEGLPLSSGDDNHHLEPHEVAGQTEGSTKGRAQACRLSSNSSSRKERAKLTGKYYLSVETARRKESYDQTSLSRGERTSTSVLFMNCTEPESQAGTDSQQGAEKNSEQEGPPTANAEMKINMPDWPAGSGKPNQNAAGGSSTEVSVSPGAGVDQEVSVGGAGVNNWEAQAVGQVHVIKAFNTEPMPIKQASQAPAPATTTTTKTTGGNRASEFPKSSDLAATVNVEREKSDKQATNNNSSNSSSASNTNSSASSFGCLSTCSCSLTHSSASSSLSCRQLSVELARSNRKCRSSLEGPAVSSSLAGGLDASRTGRVDKVAVSKDCSLEPAATCSLTSSQTNNTSRRSSLNSAEFACSSSNGPSPASSALSFQRSCASSSFEPTRTLLKARTSSIGNPLNQSSNRKLIATTSEQISVNKSEPRLHKHQHQNGFVSTGNHPYQPQSKFLTGSGDADTDCKASSPAGRLRSGSEVPRRESLTRIRLNYDNGC